MYDETLQEEINIQQQKDEVAAVAVIVRREAPTSGKPGDKALITASGEVKGWIGGGCTKGIVIKEALEAIGDLTPRLVRIQPGLDASEQEGVKNYKMTCMSGGTVEVYIEPLMPTTKIKIFGRSHIAQALCKVGTAAGFSVSVISDVAEEDMFPQAKHIAKLSEFEVEENPNDYVVVCTQGEDDEKSLATAIKTNPKYLSFVASRKKANAVFMALKRQKVPHAQLVKIKTPAGLDINAKTPDEVAISILAEIIQTKRKPVEQDSKELNEQEKQITSDLYINPVCQVPVQKSTAKHVLEYKGEKVYFCCDGCKVSFEKEPEAYIS